ncbi:hypothetical protein [Polaromonas sp.]|uniref:hypothetical protein n=1 Tax=Polaromonas sp. TaxID=1869339 RepID=UPI001D780E45|nr:hypothetical protein [Polaromonas sp.]MBT9477582.1 hypothetical protein [Polaromonas sp.]
MNFAIYLIANNPFKYWADGHLMHGTSARLAPNQHPVVVYGGQKSIGGVRAMCSQATGLK